MKIVKIVEKRNKQDLRESKENFLRAYKKLIRKTFDLPPYRYIQKRIQRESKDDSARNYLKLFEVYKGSEMRMRRMRGWGGLDP